jgi:hypothetical protein
VVSETLGHNMPNNPNYIKILIDPALVSGDRSTFGASLFLPYTFELPRGTQLVSLISLEGWISWGFNSNFDNEAKLLIPSQTVWPAPAYRLQVPINDRQIEAIENERGGGFVNLRIQLGGLAVGSGELGSVVPIQNASTSSLTI